MTRSKYTHNGKTLSIKEWSKEPEVVALGIGYNTIVGRIGRAWAFKDAITTPPSKPSAANRSMISLPNTRF